MTDGGTGLNIRNIARHLIVLAAAMLLCWVFWTGYRIGLQTERAALIAGIWTHVGHGLLATPFLVAYLWYRLTLMDTAKEHAVFLILFTFTIFLLASGPIVVWTYGSDLKVFGWFVVPNPIGKLPILHDPLEIMHKYAALVLPVLVGLDLILTFKRRKQISVA